MMHDDGDELLVCTRHGHRVPLLRPDPQSIDIQDIACGLARRYRWSAQVDLTVAQHSLNVSATLLPPAYGHVSTSRLDLARWGLLQCSPTSHSWIAP